MFYNKLRGITLRKSRKSSDQSKTTITLPTYKLNRIVEKKLLTPKKRLYQIQNTDSPIMTIDTHIQTNDDGSPPQNSQTQEEESEVEMENLDDRPSVRVRNYNDNPDRQDQSRDNDEYTDPNLDTGINQNPGTSGNYETMRID